MHRDQALADTINKELLGKFRVLDGRPIYRVTWSPTQVEKRMGTFTDWYGSIMIRQEHKALREIKKYWYIKADCWVLEKLVFVQRQQELKDIVEELVEAGNGTYEPVYTFINGDNALPLKREVVEFVIHKLQNPAAALRPSDFKAMELAEEREEVNYFEEIIGQGRRSELFIFENSAAVSTEQLKFRETYVEKTKPVVLA